MSQIKLIACDLDGTLLLNGAQTLSEETLELVEQICKKGICFLPASGRQYPNLQRLFAPVADRILYLCENGALVMKDDKPLIKQIIEWDLAMEICHAILERPEAEVLISGERTSYIIPKHESYTTFLRDEVKNNITIIDQPEEIFEPIMKVSFMTKPQDRDVVGDALGKVFAGRAMMVTSGTEWIDFAPMGTSKASALKELGEILGIRPEEMAAFGDNENDRTMLELVGHPYLMENCNPTMKNIKGATPCHRVEEELQKLL